MSNKRKLRYLTITGLLAVVLIITGLVALSYDIKPTETYRLDKGNLIEDGSFENFNQTAGDCCSSSSGEPIFFALKSENAMDGNYSLELVSSNHCACTGKDIYEFNKENKYVLSFYYKGDDPKFCNWASGENKCLPIKKFDYTKDWEEYEQLLIYPANSSGGNIGFYADSDGTKAVANFYDDLQVHKLGVIADPGSYNFQPSEEYVIKTRADNVIHNGKMISEVDVKSGEAYFLVTGEPNVTIKFPWSEMVIVLIIIVVIVRLLFKKNERAF